MSIFGASAPLSPLRELMRQLGYQGRVPLAWWLAHAPDGTLQDAWDAAEHDDAWAMCELLAVARHPAARAAWRAVRRYSGPLSVADLRRLAPEAPSVAALAAVTEPTYRELPF